MLAGTDGPALALVLESFAMHAPSAHSTLRHYWNDELEASSMVCKRRVTPPNRLFTVKGFKQD